MLRDHCQQITSSNIHGDQKTIRRAVGKKANIIALTIFEYCNEEKQCRGMWHVCFLRVLEYRLTPILHPDSCCNFNALIQHIHCRSHQNSLLEKQTLKVKNTVVVQRSIASKKILQVPVTSD